MAPDNSNCPKSLILTPVPPGKLGAGEGLLREMLLNYPEESLCCYIARSHQAGLPTDSNDFDWLPIRYSILPKSRALDYFKKRPSWFDELLARLERKKSWRALPALIDDIVRFGKEQGAERLVAVLYDPSIIMIAEQVADRLNVPLTCVIWDPPETTMLYMGYDRRSKMIVLNHFDSAINRADRISVPSENMASLYSGRKWFPLIKPISRSALKRRSESIDGSKIVIGFAGSTYAQEEFLALLKALQQLDWRIEGRDVVLRLLTDFCQFNMHFPAHRAHVELLGFRPLQETIEKLSESDILYMPFWINPNFSLSAKTCLPDKLGTYITAGRPIFCHAPSYSVPFEMVESYQLGRSCDSLEPLKIAEALIQICRFDQDKFERGRDRVIADHYDTARFTEIIHGLFGNDQLRTSVPEPVLSTASGGRRQ